MATVLVIDDDPQLRMMLRQLLERANLTVTEAANGSEGIDTFRKAPTDLVITDLIMPKKDGILAIQELLLEFPWAKVIAISGGPRGNPAWLPIAKKVGAIKILKKPFSSEQLISTVSSVLHSGGEHAY
jgi:DNA-binding NtrC family response regulator